jgi:predicted lipoprotein with Yx(FWY)xxD motif
MSMKRRTVLAGTATAAGLMLSACGSGGDAAKVSAGSEAQVPVAANGAQGAAPAAPSAAPSEAPAAAPSAVPNAPDAGVTNWKGGLSLTAVQNFIVGLTVVDNKGFTLYRFDKDTAKPSVSNCAGDCAKAWPPVEFTDKLKLQGVDRELIGNIMREDGICQATLGGWPLYRFAKDTAPGDAKGQGVGGTWFAVAPDGKKAAGGSATGGAAGDADPAGPAVPSSNDAPSGTGYGY